MASQKNVIEHYNKILLPGFASDNLSPEVKAKNNFKKTIKIITRTIVILIYGFMFGVGLYGCFQAFTDYWTTTNTTIGNGLEFGFPPFTTGNGAFDLSWSGSGPYYMFYDFTLEYGIFYAVFVWPFNQLLLHFMWATDSWIGGLNALVGIFLILLIIRIITMAISARSMMQTEKMTEVQGKVAEINAKYKDAKDMESKSKKQMEISALYKKTNVKPFASFEQIFVTLPIFLIIYRVVTTLRPLKATELFGIWDLGESPFTELLNNFLGTDGEIGGWVYIFFLLFVIPTQFLSTRFPQRLAKQRSRGAQTIGKANNEQLKKTKTIQLVMTIVMAIIVATSAAGIGLYWFFNSLFSMLQSYIIHKVILHRRKSGSTYVSKLEKLGISA